MGPVFIIHVIPKYLEERRRILSPPTLRVGIYCFSVDPVGFGVSVGVGVHFFVSVHYLLNQLMYFDQDCIYTLLGEGKELIRFC